VRQPAATRRHAYTGREALLPHHTGLPVRPPTLGRGRRYAPYCFQPTAPGHFGGRSPSCQPLCSRPGSFVPVYDSASSQIVWRQLDKHPVARQDPDVIHSHLAGYVGNYDRTGVELYLEHRVRQRFDNFSLNLDGFFFFPHFDALPSSFSNRSSPVSATWSGFSRPWDRYESGVARPRTKTARGISHNCSGCPGMGSQKMVLASSTRCLSFRQPAPASASQSLRIQSTGLRRFFSVNSCSRQRLAASRKMTA
jgi:hypothetical protein